MTLAPPHDLPEVPISVFKANPIAYAETGAVVMVHNRPRLRVVPIAATAGPSLLELKARLHLLNQLADPEAAAAERKELSAERDADRWEDPR